MLNIPVPPKSLHAIECESGPITDVIITCAVEIDPREFQLLLKGYDFSRSSADMLSYKLDLPKVGPEIRVAVEYQVFPAKFKDGGAVTVYANAEKNRAIIDYYSE